VACSARERPRNSRFALTPLPSVAGCAAEAIDLSRRLVAATVCLLATLAFAATSFASVVQEGTLRVSITTQIKPFRLPRADPAPIDVFLAGHISSTTGGVPPQLVQMTIYVNRHGVLDTSAVPVCPLDRISPATTDRALERCGPSLVGSGHFWASVVLPDQPAYRTTGRLLAFNGLSHGRPAVLAQIYTTQPFPSSFVVPFAIAQIPHGRYGTKLSAELPEALGEWGFVDRIKMTIGRAVQRGAAERSFLDASCPAPRGTRTAAFPLALADFSFAGGQSLRATVSKSCGVKE
jgi:hypothetical protein